MDRFTTLESAKSDRVKINNRLSRRIETLLKTPKQHWPFLIVLAFYFAFTFNFSLNVPVWEAPDEPAHFAYTHYIRTQGGPPIQSFEEGKNSVETGHHPPLYYYLGALVTLPWDISDFNRARTNPHFSFSNTDGGISRFDHEDEAKTYPNTITAVHLIRLISTLFGAGTLLLIYLSGLVLFGGKGWEWASHGRLPALVAVVFVATLPQFNFLSGAVNNDNAVIFFCSFTLYLCLRLILVPPTVAGPATKIRNWPLFTLIGLVVGLGLLSKYNEVVYIPLVGISLGIAAWKRRSWGYFWKSSFISGGVCLAVAGPYLSSGNGRRFLLVLLVLAAVGYYLPNGVLSRQVRRRQQTIFEDFPDALDLLTVCVEAGLGMDAALTRVADEMHIKSQALSEELQLVLLEMRAGLSKEVALRNLALRTGVEDIDVLVAMLIQAERFGTSVGESLRVHSENLRLKRRLRAEETAGKIGVKLLFPLIFCIFPTLMLVLLGPAVIQVMRVLVPTLTAHGAGVGPL